MFESLSQMSTRSGYGPKAYQHITFSCYKPNNRNAPRVKIRIPPDIAKKANINIGDRVDVLVNRVDSMVMIKQIKDDVDGWKVGKNSKDSSLSTTYTAFEGCLMPCTGKKTSIVLRPKTQDGSITFNMPDSLEFYTIPF